SLGEPSLSPDGREIAFVSGGDIWTAPAQGGEARLLVTDPATESRPIYSPDGSKLAFMSNRGGGSTNIYVLTLATGELARLTYADTAEQLDGWSRDGKWIYFSSSINDVARQNDIFRVSAGGGTPLEVSRERYLNEFESAPSPDGSTIALMAKGISNVQWWRNGHSHLDETELWLKPVADAAPYRRLLAADAKHAFPMWSPDGATLYYMSDESGAENIWKIAAGGGAAQQVTHFTDGRVLWPSIGYDGRSIVFERGFGVWRLDVASGEARPVPVALKGYPASAGDQHLKETSFRRAALSPDGKKVAVIAHGEVFAVAAKDGGPAERITHTAAAETDVLWSPDSRRLVYVSEHGVGSRLAQYDFATGKDEVLTPKAELARTPSFSPDGKRIAYIENQRELHVLVSDPKGGAMVDKLLYSGALEDDRAGPTWSPDGKWLAFVVTDHKSFSNLYVVGADGGGEARPITFLADGEAGSRIAWSPDGTYIVFDTAQRSEDVKLVRVDLLPHVPKYREDAFQDLFKPAESPDRPSRDPAHTRTHAPQGEDETPPPADEKLAEA
ncbi:MAG: LpqB family beta-propeller domain-containing protein, partial [Caulobacteraceae bacterium]